MFREATMATSAEAEALKKETSKGAWTAEEDRKLAETVASHGAKKWKTVAAKAGLNRCGKSCRLRWLNYLRPNITRGNISDQEEDLILRLHKLLGNRWSLIARRLPGRTDNEIKNYWNSHLSKKLKQVPKQKGALKARVKEETTQKSSQISETEDSKMCTYNTDPLPSELCSEGPLTLEWVSKFLEMDEGLV